MITISNANSLQNNMQISLFLQLQFVRKVLESRLMLYNKEFNSFNCCGLHSNKDIGSDTVLWQDNKES